MTKNPQAYALILEMNRLKTVFRNNTTLPDRKESTAEHSWSVTMITMMLMDNLKKEFPEVDELKALKLALVHDVVEIYAGDVMAYDIQARKEKVKDEEVALEKLMSIYPEFGKQLHDLWYEFEGKESIEAKIAKASDGICPMFLRLQSGQSYIPFKITMADVEKVKGPLFAFSKTYTDLYEQLKKNLVEKKMIEE